MRRVDPWGLAVAALGACVYLLHGFGGVLSRDLALYAYAGQQFAEGVPPYEGVLNRAGPLAHMVPGLFAMLARALGTDDLVTMRVMMFVLTVLAVYLTYLLGRDTFASRVAGAAAAATLLSSRAVVLYAGGGPREKTTMMLLVVCALLATRHRRWVLAGVATALATLTWQPSFWLCLVAALVAAGHLPWRRRWRATFGAWVRFVSGGILATAAVMAYFAFAGALDAFFEGFLFINATSTRQVGLAEFVWRLPGEMPRAWGWSLWLLIAGLVSAVVLGWRARGSTDAAGRMVVAAGAATVASFLWSLLVFNGWADAVFVVPLAAVGLGGAVGAVAGRFSARGGVALGTAYVLAVSAGAGYVAWSRSPDTMYQMRAEHDAIMDVAGPDATVQSIGSPQPLVFEGLRNPIRHQMFLTGLQDYVDETEPGGLAGITADIEQRRPTFVTVDRPAYYPWLMPTLRENYRYIGRTSRILWYVSLDVGEERIAELRDVVSGDP
ncbi:MAG TPA: glycosyltransferase family 87 protein [Ornithinimicrobium sp.]|uniref:glycosyltransferase family 87 protein n=1 Tax=Ornithinimicrobium sp. TaxID=1977084 RepID=UPI002B47A897|nr:glycosyltransferase family 87 protein [Ornithinimicrobium sp.]HKJ10793.1 glycosyltransferase family 87 protein [Ornithinimicrobium sp.]